MERDGRLGELSAGWQRGPQPTTSSARRYPLTGATILLKADLCGASIGVAPFVVGPASGRSTRATTFGIPR